MQTKNVSTAVLHFLLFLDCPAIEPFPGGQLDTPAVLEGTLAIVMCDPEHRLSGSDIIECMPGGIWSSIPTCMKGK